MCSICHFLTGIQSVSSFFLIPFNLKNFFFSFFENNWHFFLSKPVPLTSRWLFFPPQHDNGWRVWLGTGLLAFVDIGPYTPTCLHASPEKNGHESFVFLLSWDNHAIYVYMVRVQIFLSFDFPTSQKNNVYNGISSSTFFGRDTNCVIY